MRAAIDVAFLALLTLYLVGLIQRIIAAPRPVKAVKKQTEDLRRIPRPFNRNDQR